jgi:hypothetical protein
VRGWFKKRESPTGPFILTKEAQDKLKASFFPVVAEIR